MDQASVFAIGQELTKLHHLLISNVPGPKCEIIIGGVKIKELIACPTNVGRIPLINLGITYNGRVRMCSVTDKILGIDSRRILELFEEEVEKVIAKS